MSLPALTVMTPTYGRPELTRSLRSAALQAHGYDGRVQILVCLDAHDPGAEGATMGQIRPLEREFPHVEWTVVPHDAGRHDWGHSQLNAGIPHATGDYLVHNDDDDVWLPDAFIRIGRAMREAEARRGGPVPAFFRFVTHYRFVVWVTPEVRQGNLGGHNAVFPNLPDRLGTWGPAYEGDFGFVVGTLEKWPADTPIWWDAAIISVARPEPGEMG